MPIDKAAVGLSLLKDAMDAFIDNAMSRVRRSVSLEDHTPEAINYLSTVLGRDLPQPEPGSDPPDRRRLSVPWSATPAAVCE